MRRIAKLSAIPKHNVTKLETNYALKKEESQISIARRKKGLYRRLTVFFVFAVAVAYLMISTIISQNSALANKTDEKAQLKKELVALKTDEVLLKEEIVKLNDDEYIAKLARKEYFLSDDNEIIFTLPETENQEMVKSSK
jgi:cell division protein DivIC